MPDAPLRVLVVDDEAPARLRLQRMLKPFYEDGTLAVVDEAQDGVEALETLDRESAYDLVFLDVRMPELDGFDVLDRLPPRHRPAVVFTTAYDEYALRAFEANAVDYLLKPIDADRLEQSIDRARAMSRAETPADDRVARLAALLDTLDNDSMPAAAAKTGEPLLRQLSVQGRDRLLILPVEEILTAEVHDGITNLYTRSEDGGVHRHIVSFTLDALEARLDPDDFMRVHRSAIANLTAIREMIPWFSGRYKLVLAGGHEVVASRTRGRDLRDRLTL